MNDPKTKVDLGTRLALRIPEAAAVLGLSEGCFRKVLPEIEKLHAGKAVLIPVASLEKWLRKRAQAEDSADERIVHELLDGLG